MKNLILVLMMVIFICPVSLFAQSAETEKINQVKSNIAYQLSTFKKDDLISIKLASGKIINGDFDGYKKDSQDYIVVRKSLNTDKNIYINVSEIQEVKHRSNFCKQFEYNTKIAFAAVIIIITSPYTLITGKPVIQM